MSKHPDSRQRRTRGLAASFVAVALGVVGIVAVATSSSATQTPSEYVTVAWVMPGWTNSSTAVWSPGGQSYYASVETGTTKNLNALDGQLQCGVPYQVDVYNDNSTTDTLLAWAAGGGKLTASSTPKAESLISGGLGTAWKFVYTECEEEPVEVAVEPAAYTAPTCDAPGTLVGTNTESYQWIRTGPDTAAVLTATAIGDVTLTGQKVYGPYDLTQVTGEECLSEQPGEVTVDPAVNTAPTCDAPGTLVGVDTEDYQWIRTGPDTAAVLTATAISDVTLTGQKVYGPYDLTQLTGEECLSETPVIEEVTPVATAPVATATLAETGFPLLGVLGLAGSFSLIGGGLLNAGRMLRNRH